MTPANHHSGEPTSDGSPTLDQRTSKGSNTIESKPLRTTDPRNTIELEPIHHQLLVAFSHSNRAMQMRTRACGLKPGQPKVLEHLAFHEGCTQQDIARACVMDKSTVTSVLGRMEEAGLIERRAKAEDRRVAAVFLSEAGRSAASKVLDCRTEVDTIAWAGLDEQERAQLCNLLDRVIANLEQSEREERS